MGLLDDAIREHLELKRRSGADPGAIAQAEHEALDPIFPEAPTPAAEHDVAAVAVEEPQPPTVADEDFSNVGQETAELDMQAVLDEQPPTPPATTQPVRAISPSAEAEEIDWDDGGRAEQQPLPEEIPGQERLTFD